ncbi:hypothetical protein CAC42_1754 [Sphaceloma murrayae]|uniref:Uncharacterized protein n=1 Tax=Sphaceloma murrayae TaxID=2082308 RepID=A0A2K1QIM3_9PEZI|nr:hypothetical protein CAC42_1754 [Sphaceloma murrayae]
MAPGRKSTDQGGRRRPSIPTRELASLAPWYNFNDDALTWTGSSWQENGQTGSSVNDTDGRSNRRSSNVLIDEFSGHVTRQTKHTLLGLLTDEVSGDHTANSTQARDSPAQASDHIATSKSPTNNTLQHSVPISTADGAGALLVSEVTHDDGEAIDPPGIVTMKESSSDHRPAARTRRKRTTISTQVTGKSKRAVAGPLSYKEEIADSNGPSNIDEKQVSKKSKRSSVSKEASKSPELLPQSSGTTSRKRRESAALTEQDGALKKRKTAADSEAGPSPVNARVGSGPLVKVGSNQNAPVKLRLRFSRQTPQSEITKSDQLFDKQGKFIEPRVKRSNLDRLPPRTQTSGKYEGSYLSGL